ncbi:hypothetical protein IQ244_22510 [Nostoc sp. LEGE 06077]|uniref:hypothetical protein n=1 Tax=Nostoc sp. LEGE 06077 TaxID=915325 RepID=UPI0018828AD8|nr:hypothetical protein [Nostoc sp. LEGE 06077]MBE9209228.1 hypothetical protein [Nostoc sp. LEGE 06077]
MESIYLRSVSDECLFHLLQEFSALDSEVSCLIRFLLDVRSFQERCAEVGGRTHLGELGEKLEAKINQEIIIAMLVQGLSCPVSSPTEPVNIRA